LKQSFPANVISLSVDEPSLLTWSTKPKLLDRMSFSTAKAHLEQIDSLVRRRATGSPDQLAHRLGISRATWFEWLGQLRADLGLPIAYDAAAQTYYYTRPGRLVCGFIEEVPTEPPLSPISRPEKNF
jgi:biotin operon repressor